MKAPGLLGDRLRSDLDAVLVEINVAALGDGLDEIEAAVMAQLVVAPLHLPADHHLPLAVDRPVVRIERAPAQPGDADDGLEGRAGRKKAGGGDVQPGAPLLNVGGRGRAEMRRKIIEIIAGRARQHEDLARAHVERDRRPGPVAQGALRDDLQVDIERGDEVLAGQGTPLLEGGPDLVAGGIDLEDLPPGAALELGVEFLLEPVAADRCPSA